MKNINEYIATEIEIKNILKNFINGEIVIFDIGACEGEDSIRYAKLFPKSKIYSFEPINSNIEKFKKNLEKYKTKNIHLAEKALSNKIEQKSIFVSSGNPEGHNSEWDYGNKSSSLLEPLDVLIHKKWLKFEKKELIECDTLDNFCLEKNIKSIDFMHIDVQGAELLVLEGAMDMINSVKLIWLEVSEKELYKKQALFKDIQKFMKNNGFKIVLNRINKGCGDCLYANTKNFSKNKINRAFLTDLLNEKFLKKIKKVPIRLHKIIIKKYNFLKRLASGIKSLLQNKKSSKESYSQCGEDLIANFIFSVLGIKNPSYLDIGAFDPHNMNNTYIFYKKGCKGINIELNPKLFPKLKKYRKNDTNLNIGISQNNETLNYYMFDAPALNTFSEDSATKLEKETKHKVLEARKIETKNLNYIIEKYNDNIFPDFLSVDTEGLDKDILNSINYNNGPKVICTESISYSENNDGKKDEDILNLLKSKGYMLFADTHINSIFVKEDLWRKKKN